MILIQDILVSDEVLETFFACDLAACHGACCWEGDYGAPLETDEMALLDEIYDELKPFLAPAGIAIIERVGKYVYYDPPGEWGTPLIGHRDCVYLTYDHQGIGQCGIEKAWQAGAVDFRKPISCHLYPIRRRRLATGEILNYDQWDICSAACSNGRQMGLQVYEFARDALVRAYGPDWYAALDAAAKRLLS